MHVALHAWHFLAWRHGWMFIGQLGEPVRGIDASSQRGGGSARRGCMQMLTCDVCCCIMHRAWAGCRGAHACGLLKC